jgi:hypothetical protein
MHFGPGDTYAILTIRPATTFRGYNPCSSIALVVCHQQRGRMDDQDQAASDYSADSTEELLEQAQSNAQATIIATVAFLSRRAIPISEWTESLGSTFGLAWDEPEPWDAGEFLDAMLTNFRSLGATIVDADLDSDHAEATTSGFPDLDLCALFNVDPDLVAAFNDSPVPLARARSLSWEWTRTGNETRYLVRQVPAEQ